jgi:PPP family 3-phenylpropionic acid transporter
MGFIADVVAIEVAPAAGTSYGRLRLWGSLGFIAAVLPASRFVDPHGALLFPAVTTAVVFAALLASLRLPAGPARAEPPRPGAARRWLAESDFRLFLVAVFLGQSGHVAYDLCFSMHLFDLGVAPATVGVAWALGTACEVLMMAYSAPLFRAYAPATLFALALGSASVRWALIALVRSSALLLALQPLHALSFGLCWLASVNFTSRRFPSHSLATGQGLVATVTGAGSVLGMITWGSLYQRVGGPPVFAGAAAFSACACACAVALDRKLRPRFDGVSEAPEASPAQ